MLKPHEPTRTLTFFRTGLCFVLILLSDFVAFPCPDQDFGTSCHMTYASATRYLFLNLISRHFTSAITWTSNTGPLSSRLWLSVDKYARAELNTDTDTDRDPEFHSKRNAKCGQCRNVGNTGPDTQRRQKSYTFRRRRVALCHAAVYTDARLPADTC